MKNAPPHTVANTGFASLRPLRQPLPASPLDKMAAYLRSRVRTLKHCDHLLQQIGQTCAEIIAARHVIIYYIPRSSLYMYTYVACFDHHQLLVISLRACCSDMINIVTMKTIAANYCYCYLLITDLILMFSTDNVAFSDIFVNEDENEKCSITRIEQEQRLLLADRIKFETETRKNGNRACKLFNIRLYATLCFNYFR